MAQQTLSFTLDKKKYVSHSFDFETFCIINEKHLSSETVSPFIVCGDAIYHMFEGTEATNDVIGKLPVVTMAKMCNQCWQWYAETLEAISKND